MSKEKKCYAVCIITCQGDFTEPRYWESAADATEIVAGFTDIRKAGRYAERLQKKLNDKREEDDYPQHAKVISFPVYTKDNMPLD